MHLFEENNVDEITRYFHPFPLSRESAYAIAWTSHKDRYYVVSVSSRVRGLCMLRGWDEGYSIPSYGVLLDRRIQGYGLGRSVTKFAISEAKRLGCERLRLSVHASHLAARRLYEVLGFVETERRSAESGTNSDEVLIMHKTLKTPTASQ